MVPCDGSDGTEAHSEQNGEAKLKLWPPEGTAHRLCRPTGSPQCRLSTVKSVQACRHRRVVVFFEKNVGNVR